MLRTAGGLIEAHGHLKGDYGDRSRGFCVAGAMIEARRIHMMSNYSDAYFQARAALVNVVDADLFSLPAWNDRQTTSSEDVILAFKQAAENLDATA